MNSIGISAPVVTFETGSVARTLSKFFAPDLAMDLGTANTLVYVKGQGIKVNEPSMVAVEEETGKVIGVGHEARRIYGKTSKAVRCVRPMKDGVIADFEMTAKMITHMLRDVTSSWRLQRPRIVIGVPSGVTQVEKRAVIDAAMRAGVRQVFLVEESMAAAIGAQLPIDKAVGTMIVDIGGGTTEVAILSMGGTVYSQSIRVAGDEMDEAILRMIRRSHGLEIGILEAERIKLLLGSALATPLPRTLSVAGRDIATSSPRQIEITEAQVREALEEPIMAITSSIVAALEQLSPEIVHDIVPRGICLAGGGSLLRALDERLALETGMKFHRVQDPLSCVVRGVGTIVDNLKTHKHLCIA
jgi:rod shape-determining protein MreB